VRQSCRTTSSSRRVRTETNVEFVFQIDFGGHLPSILFNSYVSSSAAKVREIQEYFQALRSLSVLAMLVKIVENKLRTASLVKSKPCTLSEKEGTKIGAGLAMSMATNLTAEAGVQ